MADLTPKTINELPEQTAAEMTDSDLFVLSSQSYSKRLPWATLKAALGVTITAGWTLEFSYSGGAFNLDFVLSASERYRLTWWSGGISYQALINGEWQTIWVK